LRGLAKCVLALPARCDVRAIDSVIARNPDSPGRLPFDPIIGIVGGMFVQDVPVGAIVFLECGCRGHRLTPSDELRIVVTVEQPCARHEPKGQHVKYLDPLTTVSAFTREA
jgi:hypothetical protein